MPGVGELTPEILRKLYLEEGLAEKEIANRYGTYQVRINRLRKKWGIETLGKTGRSAKELPDLSEHQKELLVGSLLGDGRVEATSSRSSRFVEAHSPAQYSYLSWKMKILEPFVSKVQEMPKTDRATGKVFEARRFYSKSCPQLRPFYDLFYPAPERKRVFPESLFKLLTPFTLAVWFMDDGSLLRGFYPRITFGLCDKSLERALAALEELGLQTTVSDENRSTTKTILFSGNNDKFWRIVRTHIPECMAYKLPQDTEGRRQHRNARKLTTEDTRRLRDEGLSVQEIAEQSGVGVSTVRRRLSGQDARKID